MNKKRTYPLESSVTREEAEKRIPKGSYCTGCPFFHHRKMSKAEWAAFRHKALINVGATRKKVEYCGYLKSFLSIQDQVKDCQINEGDSCGDGACILHFD